ncbi:hypothetical protein E3C22_15250 [Jiella endophytica]|uniref:P/Homo B domain-containing protein n=1 Tax=Jiella endophytica TaxID=2558362 RepID=A0A4Y8RGW7_9HYPH|nr:S8 family serine peptidase [Jiella endophytica]TFF22003.1 hypothetical protein E3C22_15250 [Jiella endophytica]
MTDFENDGDTTPAAGQGTFIPSDDLYDDQWHFDFLGDIETIWDEYNGNGVTVGVYDSGIEYTHADLDGNYDPSLHLTIDGSVHDPMPVSEPHGTSVAGLIASEADGTGSVGVAFGATLAGVNLRTLFAAGGSDYYQEAFDQLDHFDVTNLSWGWGYNFQNSTYDQDRAAAFDASLSTGRDGLGTINLKAAGNDNANANGETVINATRATISVGAYDDTGDASYYSNYGANLLISSLSNGGYQGLVTTDETGSNGYDPGDYTDSFGGTSGATPIAAGVVALMLEANPDLGWRDVQTILAYSAMEVGSGVGGALTTDEEHDWFYNGADNWNGGGLHFSEDYGFGGINAYNAVRLAEVWHLFSDAQTSANEDFYSISSTPNVALTDNSVTSVLATFSPPGFSVEYVDVTLDVTHSDLSELLIELISPDGTSVELFDGAKGDGDDLPGGYLSWTFGANAFRGENLQGNWTIRVTDTVAGNTGTLNAFTIEAFGINDTNSPGSSIDDVYHFTDELSESVSRENGRATIEDTDGGTDWANAAALATNSLIDLREGAVSLIDSTYITFAGIENAVGGDGEDTLEGNDSANHLVGNRGNDLITGYGDDDTLDGGAGMDTLRGGSGNDEMRGGTGNDFYVATDAGDTVIETAGEGMDEVRALVSFTLSANVETLSLGGTGNINGTGNATANTLIGNAGNNDLNGAAGNDTIYGGDGNDTLRGGGGNDEMRGSIGDDFYVVTEAGDTVIEGAGEGIDEVRTYMAYTLGRNLEILSFGGTGNLAGTGNELANTLIGNAGNNDLNGAAGNDTLIGGAGNDTLRGGGDADEMRGGTGNDFYVVTETADTVIEEAGEGIDEVRTYMSYTLGQNLETLSFGGIGNYVGTGNELANTLIGNAGNNDLNGAYGDDTLIGGAGNDTLRGGAGADEMRGGTGNDFYVVTETTDTVVEDAGEGTDEVRTLVSYSLSDDVEILSLGGTGDIDGTGNDLANTITGNSGDNDLNGAYGNDTLNGGAGNDTLRGGAGDDEMRGGFGDDFYVVTDTTDSVIENAGEGTDEVRALISCTLGANVEDLSLGGAGNLAGTGNSLANTITGNSGDNDLNGAYGNDTLIGGAGNDTLRGGSGADEMRGEAGDDFYVVTETTDTVIEAVHEGVDEVRALISYTLGYNLETLSLGGSADLDGTGNGIANTITGNSGDNALDGAAGRDTIDGGLGNDMLTGGRGSDVFAFSSTLGANNVDTVTDFSLVEDDAIWLDDVVFTALSVGALSSAAFTIGAMAADASDRIIYDQTNGRLLYDADGTGGGAAIHFATLDAGLNLTADDFLVV